MLDIQPYVLRYWQTEFPALASKEGGGRGFEAGDLETIRRIKELLYDEGYTIASAKKKLAAELKAGKLRGRPLSPALAEGPPGGQPAANEAAKAASVKEPPGEDEPPAVESSDLGALARRVEHLEGGVATLVTQARRLAAELKPVTGAESD